LAFRARHDRDSLALRLRSFPDVSTG